MNLEDVQKLFPKDLRPYIVATEDIYQDYLRLVACKNEIKARESEIEALQFRVMRFMRDAGGLLPPHGGDKPCITWMPRAHTTFDFDGLKAAHPAIHKQYQSKATSRVFSVK